MSAAEAAGQGTPVLSIRDLQISLPGSADRAHAVDGVSLDLEAGQILCLVGESGSGKSLTARAVMGLLPGPYVRATGGQILFGGEDLLQVGPQRLREVRGAEISMIFQEPMTALNPVMTIGGQVDEVFRVHTSLTRAERQARILGLFEDVQLPDPKGILKAYPHQLSGGQRQRAMIAMALALDPKVLIADEPTTALDVTTQAQILHLIQALQASHGTGVLFITHDFGVVAEIAHHVAVLQHGKLVEAGPAETVLNHPRHPYTRSLIAAVPSLTPRSPRAFGHDQEPVLRIDSLDKSYGSVARLFGRGRKAVHAARKVTLNLARGETLGIVGESGSGKSTVARCVVRLVEADEGRILLGDTDLRSLSSSALKPMRKRVQMVFQDPYASLNPRQRVGEIIAEGPIVHGTDPGEARARALELLGLVGLEARAADRFPHEFSGGQRQRIGIARALALDPEILVADEPVSALDVSVQAQVLELLAEIRDRLHLSMLFITHDLRVAAQVCDSIAVMHQGEVVEYGPTAEIFARPQHAYTQELFAAVPGRGWTPPVEAAATA